MKKYYCKCGKKLSDYRSKACNVCANLGKNNPNYKGNKAKYKQINYCINDCGSEVYEKGNKCKKCYLANKDKENNPNWKGGLPKCLICNKKLKRRNSDLCKSHSHVGKIHSEVTKLKISKGNLGKNVSKETRKKLSLAGGGTGIPGEQSEYGSEFDSALKEKVRLRDSYKCKICGCSQVESGRQLDCHHIDFNKKSNNINNLIALCRSCHCKTNFNRKYWIKYFN